MAVLGNKEILQRLNNGEIFKEGTWKESGIKEASYVLRLAWDGLVVGGEPYPPGTLYDRAQVLIELGRIAILSTEEVLRMPPDISGKVGVRLNFAALGLLGMMGIQVDPYYGSDFDDERLYFRVANISNEVVRLRRSEGVFNIEFHHVSEVEKPKEKRQDGWVRMQDLTRHQQETSWTYITRLEQTAKAVEDRFQPLFLFGVVLVAATLLGVMAAVVINTKGASAPSWVADWGWMLLVVTFASGGLATAALVFTLTVSEAKRAWREKPRR